MVGSELDEIDDDYTGPYGDLDDSSLYDPGLEEGTSPCVPRQSHEFLDPSSETQLLVLKELASQLAVQQKRCGFVYDSNIESILIKINAMFDMLEVVYRRNRFEAPSQVPEEQAELAIDGPKQKFLDPIAVLERHILEMTGMKVDRWKKLVADWKSVKPPNFRTAYSQNMGDVDAQRRGHFLDPVPARAKSRKSRLLAEKESASSKNPMQAVYDAKFGHSVCSYLKREIARLNPVDGECGFKGLFRSWKENLGKVIIEIYGGKSKTVDTSTGPITYITMGQDSWLRFRQDLEAVVFSTSADQPRPHRRAPSGNGVKG